MTRPRWWVLDEDGTLLSTFRWHWCAARWVRKARLACYSTRTTVPFLVAPLLRWQIVRGPSR